MFGESKRTDPRSPVQHVRNPAPYVLVGAIAAIAIWTMIQSRVEDSTLPSGRAPHTQPARNPEGSLAGLFSADDYPAEALDRNEQGRVGVRVRINTAGRVRICDVVSSSGSKILDKATCDIIRRRARFRPATNSSGEPTESTYSQTIKWQIAD